MVCRAPRYRAVCHARLPKTARQISGWFVIKQCQARRDDHATRRRNGTDGSRGDDGTRGWILHRVSFFAQGEGMRRGRTCLGARRVWRAARRLGQRDMLRRDGEKSSQEPVPGLASRIGTNQEPPGSAGKREERGIVWGGRRRRSRLIPSTPMAIAAFIGVPP